jgi:hypothetical protein
VDQESAWSDSDGTSDKRSGFGVMSEASEIVSGNTMTAVERKEWEKWRTREG